MSKAATKAQGIRCMAAAVVMAMGLPLVVSPAMAQPEQEAQVPTVTSMALYGKPKLPANFTHLPYVNPDAPKGGTLVQASAQRFDSTNPFIVGVNRAPGMKPLYNSYVYDSLMSTNFDETFSEYPLIAKSLRIAPDRSWVEFDIDPRARFSDGVKVTAQDVVFSFHTLVDKGSPMYKSYWAEVAKAYVPRPGVVRFDFKPDAPRELPLDLGQLPILPEHYWKHRDFTQPTFDAPVGSGPYRVTQVIKGSRIVYTRNPDYWAKDLPANRGRYNFDTLVYDTYTDDAVALQAFLSGRTDLRVESSIANWANNYTGPAMERGDIVKFHVGTGYPGFFEGYAMNQRNPLFKDRRVRQALAMAFDFDTMNRLLFHGLYTRDVGYYDNSVLQAKGLPDQQELALLNPLRKQLPSSVFKEPLASNAKLTQDQRLEKAYHLLTQAGYHLRGFKLVDPEGKPVAFTILLQDKSQARTALAYTRDLKRLGIDATIRVVDPALYQVMLGKFQYDMTPVLIGQSNSPGTEQASMWGSSYADVPHSQNVSGIKNPAVDQLIKDIIAARSAQQVVTRTHALDRVLRNEYYYVPTFYQKAYNVARWRQIKVPARDPRYGPDFDRFWLDKSVHNESVGAH